MKNYLSTSTSPYLRQHQDNPVHWLPWGDQAFSRAKRENKPILLSIGYAACHWCHVMAHESFENPMIARLMNENFVCVKVDREERPDLDQVYQAALAALEGQGGWPLTMFLSYDGTPFWGGTYFPPEPRWGRTAFPDVLSRIASLYRDRPEIVEQGSADLSAAMSAFSQPDSGAAPELSHGFLDRAAETLLPAFDPVHGGLRGAPKFPQLVTLELLWRAYLRSKNNLARTMVTLSLDRMCQGGIYDHVGGGFSRYSVDEEWLVPHFEKMLYDNAQFISLLTQVWRETGNPLYAARVRETVDWALSNLTTTDGAFVSSYDADSDGEEGLFYVWTPPEIRDVLGDRAEAFCETFDVHSGGNWEGVTILNRSQHPAWRGDIEEASIARDLQALRVARSKRTAPTRDDKVLADWNGLMICALVEAGASFAEAKWIAAAERTFASVTATLWDGTRLSHSACRGQASTIGFLDDYASMARAALLLHEVTGLDTYQNSARKWMAILQTDFIDPKRGGYFYAAKGADQHLLLRPLHARDTAQPSGNGLAAEVWTRLWLMDGEEHDHATAESVIRAFAGDAVRYPVALATLLNAYDRLAAGVQVVIVGRRNTADTDALLHAAYRLPTMNRCLQVVNPDDPIPVHHPAAGKNQIGGVATAYICCGPVCGPPITDPEMLRTIWNDWQ